MALHSNYPKGFAQGVSIHGIPILNTYSGKVFWVYNGSAVLVGQRGGSDGNKGTFDAPFSTLDFAVGKCTANRGDTIMVKPGHVETYSAAAGLVGDVAGIHFQGLGNGTDRPKIIMDTAVTVDIDISAANISIDNFQFEAAFADIEKIFHVTAKQFHVTNCEFREQVATENWVLIIDADGTTNNEVDGLHFNNNVVIGADTANENILKGAADITGLEVNDNYIELGILNDDAIIEMLTGQDLRSLQVLRNRVLRLNTAGEIWINTDTTTANTGIFAYNLLACLDIAAIVQIQAGTHIFQFENYVTSELDLSGFLDPPAATDT